jgi:hypothetical protein
MVDDSYNRHIRRLEGQIADLLQEIDDIKDGTTAVPGATGGGDSYLKTEHIDSYDAAKSATPVITAANGKIAKNLVFQVESTFDIHFMQSL